MSSSEVSADGSTRVRKFAIGFPESELTELRRRIDATRWPEKETVDDDSQGVPLAMMQDLARHWVGDYDWGKCEAKLNGLPNFLTEIDGLDGMPANPGVNPSLSITALVERAIALWPNNGDEDSRPPLGSGHERVDPVMPHRPFVPAGAPGELRLDARKDDVIPEYPY